MTPEFISTTVNPGKRTKIPGTKHDRVTHGNAETELQQALQAHSKARDWARKNDHDAYEVADELGDPCEDILHNYPDRASKGN